jgi:hypothetical protein
VGRSRRVSVGAEMKRREREGEKKDEGEGRSRTVIVEQGRKKRKRPPQRVPSLPLVDRAPPRTPLPPPSPVLLASSLGRTFESRQVDDLNLRRLVEGADLLDLVEGETVREGGRMEADGGTEEGVVEDGKGGEVGAVAFVVSETGRDTGDDVLVVGDAPEDVGAIERRDEGLRREKSVEKKEGRNEESTCSKALAKFPSPRRGVPYE